MYENKLFLDCDVTQDLPGTALILDFLEDCEVRNFSPRTIQSYKSNLKYFLSRHSIEITPEVLKSFLVHIRDEKNYSPSTVENYFASISSFYDFLEWEGVQKNIVPQFRKRYLRYYKEQRHEERQLINLEQMKDLIDSAEWIGFKAMFLFFAKTGIRRQELINLDLQDLFLSKNYAILKPHAKRSNRIVFYDDEMRSNPSRLAYLAPEPEAKNPRKSPLSWSSGFPDKQRHHILRYHRTRPAFRLP